MAKRKQAMARRRAALAVGVASVLGVVGRALGGLTFNISGTLPANMAAGFAIAEQRWQANITDNVTVNISVGTSSGLGTNVFSTTLTSSTVTYTGYRTALTGAATSTDDSKAISSLTTASAFSIYLNYTSDNPHGVGSSAPYVDNNGSTNNSTIYATQALQRRLGLTANNTSDGTIIFSSTQAYDYNPNDGIAAGQLDFAGVATREIGRVLGFASGVDILDTNSSTNFFTGDQFARVRPLDLFRYSASSVANSSIDWTAGTGTKYFSLDKGLTSIAPFATGVVHGDGQNAGGWKAQSPSLGIMDQTTAAGQALSISEVDRRVFDVIGWTRDNTWDWTSPAGGNANAAINWDADGLPTSGQDAVFELGATYSANVTVTGANLSVRDLINRKDVLTIVPDGTNRTLTAARNLIVGDTAGSTASLTITAGILSTATTTLGTAAGATGSFTFSGATWVNTGATYVGGTPSAAAGTGVLSVAATGQAQLQGGLRVYAGGSASISSGLDAVGGLIVDAGGKVALTGPATVTFTGALINNGALTVTGGSISMGTVTGTGTFTVSGASVLTAARVVQGSVTMTGGTLTVAPFGGNASVSAVDTIAISGTGFLDLKDNDLIITTTPELNVKSLVASWFDAGVRNGKGLGTSIPAAAAAGSAASYTTLGVITNSNGEGGMLYSTFDGVSGLTTSTVLVKYTYLGDTDLNGAVDASDLANLLAGMRGGPGGWVNGDVDLNGVVNSVDLGYLMSALAHQGAPLSGGNAGGNGAVPEPGIAAGGMSVAAAGSRRRRRR